MSDRQVPEVGAVPAGTIIVVDAAAGTVLLLRRRDSLRFMGGFWAFPGGAVDAADADDQVAGQHVRGVAAAVVAAAGRAACRELREEAGLEIPPRSLVHWAHWITPSGALRRFDTHFFVALRPSGRDARLASAESSELRWAEPAWVASGPRDFPVTAPTQVELLGAAALLRAANSPEEFLAAARARAVRTVVPRLCAGAAVMPWDEGYAGLPGEGVEWDADACLERAGWPSRWPAVVPTRQ